MNSPWVDTLYEVVHLLQSNIFLVTSISDCSLDMLQNTHPVNNLEVSKHD